MINLKAASSRKSIRFHALSAARKQGGGFSDNSLPSRELDRAFLKENGHCIGAHGRRPAFRPNESRSQADGERTLSEINHDQEHSGYLHHDRPPRSASRRRDRANAAALDGTIWDVKQLTVYFMNGVQQYWDEVQKNVKVWEQFAAIEFVFTSDPNALIRVSFEPPFSPQGQFNSVIGSQAKLVDPSQPTVNLGFLPDTAEDEYARLILHEFGHTLGLIHEHQSPNAGINFKIPQVFQYFAQYGWTADMVQSNILNRYTLADVHNATAFDMNSIMLYPFPAEIAEPPTGVNRVLSDLDKQLISSMYPGIAAPVAPVPPVVPLPTVPPGIPLVLGDVAETGLHGRRRESNPLQFHRDDARHIRDGDTRRPGVDAVGLRLREPDDSFASRQLREGQGLNAKIVQALDPGTYFLVLAHLLPDGTGPFTISVGSA